MEINSSRRRFRVLGSGPIKAGLKRLNCPSAKPGFFCRTLSVKFNCFSHPSSMLPHTFEPPPSSFLAFCRVPMPWFSIPPHSRSRTYRCLFLLVLPSTPLRVPIMICLGNLRQLSIRTGAHIHNNRLVRTVVSMLLQPVHSTARARS